MDTPGTAAPRKNSVVERGVCHWCGRTVERVTKRWVHVKSKFEDRARCDVDDIEFYQNHWSH